MERVGVRELRQNLSVYLERVKAGETLEVTEHRQPVAVIAPLPRKPMSVLERLEAEGRLIPAKGDLLETLKTITPIKVPPGEKSLADIVLEMREEDDR